MARNGPALVDAGPDAVPETLKPFVVYRAWSDELIGVLAAAIRLEVSRTTGSRGGNSWAWKTTKRGYRIAFAQILGPGTAVGDRR